MSSLFNIIPFICGPLAARGQVEPYDSMRYRKYRVNDGDDHDEEGENSAIASSEVRTKPQNPSVSVTKIKHKELEDEIFLLTLEVKWKNQTMLEYQQQLLKCVDDIFLPYQYEYHATATAHPSSLLTVLRNTLANKPIAYDISTIWIVIANAIVSFHDLLSRYKEYPIGFDIASAYNHNCFTSVEYAFIFTDILLGAIIRYLIKQLPHSEFALFKNHSIIKYIKDLIQDILNITHYITEDIQHTCSVAIGHIFLKLSTMLELILKKLESLLLLNPGKFTIYKIYMNEYLTLLILHHQQITSLVKTLCGVESIHYYICHLQLWQLYEKILSLLKFLEKSYIKYDIEYIMIFNIWEKQLFQCLYQILSLSLSSNEFIYELQKIQSHHNHTNHINNNTIGGGGYGGGGSSSSPVMMMMFHPNTTTNNTLVRPSGNPFIMKNTTSFMTNDHILLSMIQLWYESDFLPISLKLLNTISTTNTTNNNSNTIGMRSPSINNNTTANTNAMNNTAGMGSLLNTLTYQHNISFQLRYLLFGLSKYIHLYPLPPPTLILSTPATTSNNMIMLSTTSRIASGSMHGQGLSVTTITSGGNGGSICYSIPALERLNCPNKEKTMTTIYEIICYLLPQFHPPYHTTPYFMNDQLFILLPYFLSLLLKFSISITKEEGSYVTIQWIYQDLVQRLAGFVEWMKPRSPLLRATPYLGPNGVSNTGNNSNGASKSYCPTPVTTSHKSKASSQQQAARTSTPPVRKASSNQHETMIAATPVDMTFDSPFKELRPPNNDAGNGGSKKSDMVIPKMNLALQPPASSPGNRANNNKHLPPLSGRSTTSNCNTALALGPAAAAAMPLGGFQVGDVVDSLCTLPNGSQRWYPGKVSEVKVQSTGEGELQRLYVIHFNDGDVKPDIPEAKLRKPKRNMNRASNGANTPVIPSNNTGNSGDAISSVGSPIRSQPPSLLMSSSAVNVNAFSTPVAKSLDVQYTTQLVTESSQSGALSSSSGRANAFNSPDFTVSPYSDKSRSPVLMKRKYIAQNMNHPDMQEEQLPTTSASSPSPNASIKPTRQPSFFAGLNLQQVEDNLEDEKDEEEDLSDDDEDRIYEIPSIFEHHHRNSGTIVTTTQSSGASKIEMVVPRMHFGNLPMTSSLSHLTSSSSLSASLLPENFNDTNATYDSGRLSASNYAMINSGRLSVENGAYASPMITGHKFSARNNPANNVSNNSSFYSTSRGGGGTSRSMHLATHRSVNLMPSTHRSAVTASEYDDLMESSRSNSKSTQILSYRHHTPNSIMLHPNKSSSDHHDPNMLHNTSMKPSSLPPPEMLSARHSVQSHYLNSNGVPYSDPYAYLSEQEVLYIETLTPVYALIVKVLFTQCLIQDHDINPQYYQSPVDPLMSNPTAFGSHPNPMQSPISGASMTSQNILFVIREYLELCPSEGIKQDIFSYCTYYAQVQGLSRLCKLLNASFLSSCLTEHVQDPSCSIKIGEGGFGSIYRVKCIHNQYTRDNEHPGDRKTRNGMYYQHSHCYSCYQANNCYYTRQIISTQCQCWRSATVAVESSPIQPTFAIKRIPRERSAYDPCMLVKLYNEITCLEACQASIGFCGLEDYGIYGSEYWMILERGYLNLLEWRQDMLLKSSLHERMASTKDNNVVLTESQILQIVKEFTIKSVTNYNDLAISTNEATALTSPSKQMTAAHVLIICLLYLDMLSIISELHTRYEIVHYDLKCANWMLREGISAEVLLALLQCHLSQTSTISDNEVFPMSGVLFLIDFGESIYHIEQYAEVIEAFDATIGEDESNEEQNAKLISSIPNYATYLDILQKSRGTLPIQSPEMICVSDHHQSDHDQLLLTQNNLLSQSFYQAEKLLQRNFWENTPTGGGGGNQNGTHGTRSAASSSKAKPEKASASKQTKPSLSKHTNAENNNPPSNNNSRKGKSKFPIPSYASDIWSLGCLLVELLLGRMYFENQSWPELYTKLCLFTPIQLDLKCLSQQLTNLPNEIKQLLFSFITGTLQQQPHARLSLIQMIQGMKVIIQTIIIHLTAPAAAAASPPASPTIISVKDNKPHSLSSSPPLPLPLPMLDYHKYNNRTPFVWINCGKDEGIVMKEEITRYHTNIWCLSEIMITKLLDLTHAYLVSYNQGHFALQQDLDTCTSITYPNRLQSPPITSSSFHHHHRLHTMQTLNSIMPIMDNTNRGNMGSNLITSSICSTNPVAIYTARYQDIQNDYYRLFLPCCTIDSMIANQINSIDITGEGGEALYNESNADTNGKEGIFLPGKSNQDALVDLLHHTMLLKHIYRNNNKGGSGGGGAGGPNIVWISFQCVYLKIDDYITNTITGNTNVLPSYQIEIRDIYHGLVTMIIISIPIFIPSKKNKLSPAVLGTSHSSTLYSPPSFSATANVTATSGTTGGTVGNTALSSFYHPMLSPTHPPSHHHLNHPHHNNSSLFFTLSTSHPALLSPTSSATTTFMMNSSTSSITTPVARGGNTAHHLLDTVLSPGGGRREEEGEGEDSNSSSMAEMMMMEQQYTADGNNEDETTHCQLYLDAIIQQCKGLYQYIQQEQMKHSPTNNTNNNTSNSIQQFLPLILLSIPMATCPTTTTTTNNNTNSSNSANNSAMHTPHVDQVSGDNGTATAPTATVSPPYVGFSPEESQQPQQQPTASLPAIHKLSLQVALFCSFYCQSTITSATTAAGTGGERRDESNHVEQVISQCFQALRQRGWSDDLIDYSFFQQLASRFLAAPAT